MRRKRVESAAEAVPDVADGATVFVGGFGQAGIPRALIAAVSERKVRELTIVNNNAGYDDTGVAQLFRAGCVSKLICSFPWYKESAVFRSLYDAGKIQLEIVPQGTLAERIRAGGAGIGGFLTRTAVGTDLSAGKETMEVNGVCYILEMPLRADFALIRADRADPIGNLTYRKAARNFNPVMATAANVVVAEVTEEVGVGDLDPECVVTPGLFVTRYLVTGQV